MAAAVIPYLLRLPRRPAKPVSCLRRGLLLLLAAPPLLAVPAAQARDSLGVFGTWGAFRDPAVPRCYAIAVADPSSLRRDYQPFVAVGTWPRRGERGQVHFRLARRVAPGRAVTLALGGQRFTLLAAGADAWAADRRMDAAIVAAMRSAPGMWLNARDERGNPFGSYYRLAGAATAMDAATVGCARL